MTSRAQIEELVARLEAAKEGSRELNNLIAPIVGWHRVEPQHTSNKKGAWIAPQDWVGTMSGGSPILDGLHGTDMHRDPPDFTRSVDAALKLVPERWSIDLSVDSIGATAACLREDEKGWTEWQTKARSVPALACCLAIFRARLSEIKD